MRTMPFLHGNLERGPVQSYGRHRPSVRAMSQQQHRRRKTVEPPGHQPALRHLPSDHDLDERGIQPHWRAAQQLRHLPRDNRERQAGQPYPDHRVVRRLPYDRRNVHDLQIHSLRHAGCPARAMQHLSQRVVHARQCPRQDTEPPGHHGLVRQLPHGLPDPS